MTLDGCLPERFTVDTAIGLWFDNLQSTVPDILLYRLLVVFDVFQSFVANVSRTLLDQVLLV